MIIQKHTHNTYIKYDMTYDPIKHMISYHELIHLRLGSVIRAKKIDQ